MAQQPIQAKQRTTHGRDLAFATVWFAAILAACAWLNTWLHQQHWSEQLGSLPDGANIIYMFAGVVGAAAALLLTGIVATAPLLSLALHQSQDALFELLEKIKDRIANGTDDAKVQKQHRNVLDSARLAGIRTGILASLTGDLSRLRGASILLDPNVDYGLPISRKQTLGRLPFGTVITPNGSTIASGVYWENAWGASDLDLSAIKTDGERVGWGMRSGYTRGDVIFSGDLTDATNGAMEFMTSKASYQTPYALFVNVFNGDHRNSQCELVIGTKTKTHWIESPVVREKTTLLSRGSLIGFVVGGKFIVYACRLNSNAWSVGSKETAIVARGLADFWTVRKLLDALGISYSVTRTAGVAYDYDLGYQSFSLDKLEDLLLA